MSSTNGNGQAKHAEVTNIRNEKKEALADVFEQKGAVGYGKPPKHTQFQPGQSGNVGGVRKGTVFLSEVYKRFLTMDNLESYVPKNAAEEIGLDLFARARGKNSKEDALAAAKEIADRTEGRPRQAIDAQVNVSVDIAVVIAEARRLLNQYYPDQNWLEAPDEEVRGWIEIHAKELLEE